ncbi:hypothetical protein AB0F73_22155, partial [Micromonospora purpureochromogenes]
RHRGSIHGGRRLVGHQCLLLDQETHRSLYRPSCRYARNRRLADAVHQWAFCALKGSPGARAYYNALRTRGTGHQAALRQLGNRLVGILHGCLKTNTTYDEATAWAHLQPTS